MLRMFESVCRTCYNVHTTQLRFAGHNKWSNIKDIKAAKDAIKSKRNTAFSVRIKTCIRERNGDNNPDTNSTLRKLLVEAKASDVPKATIENAIKNFKNTDAIEQMSEVKLPGGVVLLVQGLAKNRAHMLHELQTITKKKGGEISKGGMVSLFERKGVILAELGTEQDLELVEEHAIEAGAEEVNIINQQEKTVEFITGSLEVGAVRDNLEKIGYRCIDSEMQYLPNMPVTPGPLERKAANSLIEALEASELVTAVHPNF